MTVTLQAIQAVAEQHTCPNPNCADPEHKPTGAIGDDLRYDVTIVIQTDSESMLGDHVVGEDWLTISESDHDGHRLEDVLRAIYSEPRDEAASALVATQVIAGVPSRATSGAWRWADATTLTAVI